ncbi:MAG: glycerophosphodiester phosphodiesterase, partial [Candidatus Hodarchaeota archaeon]
MNEKRNRSLIIGHRGAYDSAPENTLKGFRKAIELGADYIEFDVHASQDEALVVIHDTDILRRMGHEGFIKNMTLAELKNLDLGEGESIPELKEVINLAKGKINFLCELKAKGIVDKVIRLIRDEDIIDSTIIQSFHIDDLLEVRRIESQLKLAALVPFNEEYIPEWDKRKKMIQEIIELEFPIIVTRYQNVDKNFLHYS